MALKKIFRGIRHMGQRLNARWPVGAACLCCVCGRQVQRFLPYRDGLAGMPEVVVEADIIGSDVEHFECPACGCHDRERHLYLYLQATRLLAAMHDARVLHFAPEAHLQRLIASAVPAEYVRADLNPSRAGVRRLDLTAIDQPPDRFDFVIANHVLEHVADDTQALKEILRVLKPGGRAILQTPFAARRAMKFEDPRLIDPCARLHAYGQEDHRRLYGVDFVDYVCGAGFVSQVAAHTVLLPEVDSSRSGVNPREPLLLFAKPGAPA